MIDLPRAKYVETRPNRDGTERYIWNRKGFAARALPAIPVTVQKARVNACLHFVVLLSVELPFVAGVVRAAIGVHVARENQVLPVGRKQHPARFGR